MGKGKLRPFKRLRKADPAVVNTFTMAREQFKQVIAYASRGPMDTEVKEQLQALTSSIDRIVFGAWEARESPLGEVCGCPLASISDILDSFSYSEHPGKDVDEVRGAFVSRYDERMRNLHGTRYGIVHLTD